MLVVIKGRHRWLWMFLSDFLTLVIVSLVAQVRAVGTQNYRCLSASIARGDGEGADRGDYPWIEPHALIKRLKSESLKVCPEINSYFKSANKICNPFVPRN